MWTRDTTQENNTPRPAQPAAVPPPTPTRPAEERRVVAWVGKTLLFRGDLIGLEDMIVDGRVEGTIELRDNALTVGPDAHIQADITAKSVTVHGTVVGSITATQTIFIGETGRVDGNLTSRRLAMAEGAVIKGHVTAGEDREAKAAGKTSLQGAETPSA